MMLLGLTLIFFKLTVISGSNVLVFMPSPLRSHLSTYKPLFKELAIRGHNVTFYTAVPYDEEIPNMKQIVIDYGFHNLFGPTKLSRDRSNMNGWRHIIFLQKLGLLVSEQLLQHAEIQALIQSTELSFDVIMIETFFAHEPFVALGHKFNAPLIHLHPFRDEVWISEILRNPQPLSYVPNIRLPGTDNMSFCDRFYNMILSVMQVSTGYLYYLPEQERLMHKYFKYPGLKNLPPLIDQLRNTSLVFLDGNHIVGPVSPLVPNFIPVGGIHIGANKPIPLELETWINDSPEGIIYFSLGSMEKMINMEAKKLQVFINVLGRLPQRILWKWENDSSIPGQPPNVKTSKWFPQLDILAHPKCRLFITHGGFHSLLEAAYYGVPLVGIPLYADQENNLIMAESKGIGKMVKESELIDDTLFSTVDKVLKDPRFQENARHLSNLMKDAPQTPMDRALYWVEHTIKYKGVPHLTPAGLYLPWYQYYMVDVIVLTIIMIICILFVLNKIVQCIFKLCINRMILNKVKNE